MPKSAKSVYLTFFIRITFIELSFTVYNLGKIGFSVCSKFTGFYG